MEGAIRALWISAGAGEGNRTLVYSLGSCRSAIELRPRSVAADFIIGECIALVKLKFTVSV